MRLPLNRAKRWADLLSLPKENAFPPSFANLLQLHLLKSMRVEHRIPLQRVRRALPLLRDRYGSDYPLLQVQLHTDGLDIFLRDSADEIINISRSEQKGIREHFDLYLRRVDLQGDVAKLYPFVRPEEHGDAPAEVVIRPDVGFGRPTVAGTGIHTHIVASRFHAGDSLADLLSEYELSQSQMEEVLRWEMQSTVHAA